MKTIWGVENNRLINKYMSPIINIVVNHADGSQETITPGVTTPTQTVTITSGQTVEVVAA